MIDEATKKRMHLSAIKDQEGKVIQWKSCYSTLKPAA